MDLPGQADAVRILASCGLADEPLEPVDRYSSNVSTRLLHDVP